MQLSNNLKRAAEYIPLGIATLHQLKRFRSDSYTATTTKKRNMGTNFASNAGRTKFKHRKPKPINSWPKGLSHKFERKVKKALAVNDIWGKYIYTSRVRLRQVDQDRYSLFTQDELTSPLDFGTAIQYIDAASILFKNKVPTADVSTTTGNMTDDAKLEIVKSSAEMFFKSSSGHVVNLEVYECTPKTPQSERLAITDVEQSYSAMVGKYYQTDIAGSTLMNPRFINSSPEDWVQLYQKWNVKKHVVKLLPGQSTSLYFKGVTNKTIDMSKIQLDNQLARWVPQCNSKNFFIRVLNDISVSRVTGSVYHWQSNNDGGVACEFKRTYTMRPPPSGTDDIFEKNTIINGLWRSNPGSSVDQQISVENPVQNSNTDI